MDATQIITLAAVGLTVLVGGAVAVRLLLPRLIRKMALRKLNEAQLAEFDVLAELLENGEVVDTLAPPQAFQVPIDRESNKKPHQQKPWLSPYPEAVKAANKRRKHELKGKQYTLTRKQIAAAASMVSVEVMPEALQPANAGPEHFFITFQLRGLTEQKIKGLAPHIIAQLGLHSLLPMPSSDYRSVRFEAHTVEPVDRLTNEKHGRDFFEAHPVENLASIPLAVTANGEVWNYPTHHGLILGMTGSGKGSPLQGLIRQVAPAVKEGRVRLFGIDPKNSEFKSFSESSLFEQLVLGQAEDNVPEAMALIERTYDLMMKRGREVRVNLEDADLGRSLDYTTETPLILLMIDELLSLLIAFQDRGKEGKRCITLLTTILAQGRSLGVIVIAATQEADKELLGRMRNNFANVIVLKQPSAYFNDLFLGEGAAAAGFDSTKIAPANKSNGYATAGIGFVKEETGNPVRVRFAYSSDRDIADLVLANRKPLASRVQVQEEDPFEEPTEKDIEESWGFVDGPEEDDEDDNGEAGLPPIK
ncbi:FtsK/SpoIIIE domain-containing protein [Microbacterium sp. CIAB417]|uniref:FtsK/SpoIIIE domain-containing protein n=1 Tax=Microbacterium sp. CIAB417 TaxID=2860287 RepID=UPI001FADB561|nr:FtsK/SpoIIIE domain-containing protein [Microbacterium sp. CIAB417]